MSTPEQDRRLREASDMIRPLGAATEAARVSAQRALEIAREAVDVQTAPELETEEDVAEWARALRQSAADLAEAGHRLRTLADLAPAKLACWGVVAVVVAGEVQP